MLVQSNDLAALQSQILLGCHYCFRKIFNVALRRQIVRYARHVGVQCLKKYHNDHNIETNIRLLGIYLFICAKRTKSLSKNEEKECQNVVRRKKFIAIATINPIINYKIMLLSCYKMYMPYYTTFISDFERSLGLLSAVAILICLALYVRVGIGLLKSYLFRIFVGEYSLYQQAVPKDILCQPLILYRFFALSCCHVI